MAEKGGVVTVYVTQGEHNEWKVTERTFGEPRQIQVESETAIYAMIPAIRDVSAGYPGGGSGRGRCRGRHRVEQPPIRKWIWPQSFATSCRTQECRSLIACRRI